MGRAAGPAGRLPWRSRRAPAPAPPARPSRDAVARLRDRDRRRPRPPRPRDAGRPRRPGGPDRPLGAPPPPPGPARDRTWRAPPSGDARLGGEVLERLGGEVLERGPVPGPTLSVRRVGRTGPSSVLDGLLRADAGEGTDLELRGLELVRALLGELRAEPAQEERERDRHEAGVVQREPGEVHVLDQRRALAGQLVHRRARDDRREDDQPDAGDEPAVD